jgi:hypothetical protein
MLILISVVLFAFGFLLFSFGITMLLIRLVRRIAIRLFQLMLLILLAGIAAYKPVAAAQQGRGARRRNSAAAKETAAPLTKKSPRFPARRIAMKILLARCCTSQMNLRRSSSRMIRAIGSTSFAITSVLLLTKDSQISAKVRVCADGKDRANFGRRS